MKRTIRFLPGLIIAAMLLAACAPAALAPDEEAQLIEQPGLAEPAAEEPAAEAPAGYANDAAEAVKPAEEAGASVGVPAPETRSDDSAAPAVGGEAGVSVAPLPTSAPLQPIQPDQQFQSDVTAGKVDDNEDFQAYLQYRRDYERFVGLANVHDVDISERHIIFIRTNDGRPVLGARVEFYQGQSLIASLQSPATGLVYFFPRAYSSDPASISAVISKDGVSAQVEIDRSQTDSLHSIGLSVPATQPPVNLDVLFLIDATGSMSDEIEQLKQNILSISAQIEALPSNPDVRFGMVSYRDRGDDYVTRVFNFTSDVQRFQNDLRGVYAAGGGDTPEALNEGIHDAIWNVDWREQEDTVRMVFLVADAPPHLDYPQDYDYAAEMQNAASLSIKIFPISSFLDDGAYSSQAEYIFRQMAQFTGAPFIFLTYDSQPQAGGTPGRDDVSVPEESYSVEQLDALVVRLVQDELAALSGGQQ